jgi:hypothetical protein
VEMIEEAALEVVEEVLEVLEVMTCLKDHIKSHLKKKSNKKQRQLDSNLLVKDPDSSSSKSHRTIQSLKLSLLRKRLNKSKH